MEGETPDRGKKGQLNASLSLAVTCWLTAGLTTCRCRPRMVCTGCGIVGPMGGPIGKTAVETEPDRSAMVLTMAKMPNPQSIAAALTVPERLLLFCLASDTDWQKAGITHATAEHVMVRGLIEREHGATRYALTDQRRAVLGALLAAK